MRRLSNKDLSIQVQDLCSQASEHLKKGKYADGLSLLRQACKLGIRLEGKERTSYAAASNMLGLALTATTDYQEAERAYMRAIDLFTLLHGENDREVACCLGNLGGLYMVTGRYDLAEPIFLQSLDIIKTNGGEDKSEYAATTDNLAKLYRIKGDYELAEPLFLKAKILFERIFGQCHSAIIINQTGLGVMYLMLGRYDEAEQTFRNALDCSMQLFGEEHPFYICNLNNLGLIAFDKGNLTEAEKIFRYVLKLASTNLGEEHPYYTQTLNNLGAVLCELQLLGQAEELFLRSLDLTCKIVGENHPFFATVLNNLGWINHRVGNYPAAEDFYRRALDIRARVLGEKHLDYVVSINHLAGPLVASGRWKEACQYIQKGTSIVNELLARLVIAMPEEKAMAFNIQLETHTDMFLTLIWRFLPEDRKAVAEALDLVWRRKAIIYEASLIRQQTILNDKYPHLRAIFAELKAKRDELARREFDQYDISSDNLAAHIMQLEKDIDDLEMQLAQQLPKLDMALRIRTADKRAIAEHLPADSMLVEFVRFTPYRFEAQKDEPCWQADRYLAFILFSGRPDQVQMIDLGSAEEIDLIIRDFQTIMVGENPQRSGDHKKYKMVEKGNGEEAICRQLYDRLFTPVLRNMPERTVTGPPLHIIIAPAGELYRVPFEICLSEQGRFLVEDYLISYVTVGCDIVAFGIKGHTNNEAVILADPDYDFQDGEGYTKVPDPVPDDDTVEDSNIINFLRTAGRGFARLPGTRKEAEHLKEILENNRIRVIHCWLGDEALETRLKSVCRPKILHLATHGFFLADAQRALRPQLDGIIGLRRYGSEESPISNTEHGGPTNPYLRSGLVLAGINSVLGGQRVPAEVEDAIFTGLDVLSLNLVDTDLVVLSACKSGWGELRSGEGVVGLRRAFAYAGARTLITSLWEVPDEMTFTLMHEFYQQLLNGQGRAQSLNNAKRKLIKMLRNGDEAGFVHPFLWAAFVCHGDPAVLTK